MTQVPEYLSAAHWLQHLFSAKAAQYGGVVRRKVRDVERFVGRQAFEGEIRRRGYRAIENGGDYIILCNQSDVRLIE